MLNKAEVPNRPAGERKAELLRQQQVIEKELAEIDREEKRRTTEEIRRIAEAAGLSVTITEKGKKRRGRPPGSGRQGNGAQTER